jgi:hypothetical protein
LTHHVPPVSPQHRRVPPFTVPPDSAVVLV